MSKGRRKSGEYYCHGAGSNFKDLHSSDNLHLSSMSQTAEIWRMLLSWGRVKFWVSTFQLKSSPFVNVGNGDICGKVAHDGCRKKTMASRIPRVCCWNLRGWKHVIDIDSEMPIACGIRSSLHGPARTFAGERMCPIRTAGKKGRDRCACLSPNQDKLINMVIYTKARQSCWNTISPRQALLPSAGHLRPGHSLLCEPLDTCGLVILCTIVTNRDRTINASCVCGPILTHKLKAEQGQRETQRRGGSKSLLVVTSETRIWFPSTLPLPSLTVVSAPHSVHVDTRRWFRPSLSNVRFPLMRGTAVAVIWLYVYAQPSLRSGHLTCRVFLIKFQCICRKTLAARVTIIVRTIFTCLFLLCFVRHPWP